MTTGNRHSSVTRYALGLTFCRNESGGRGKKEGTRGKSDVCVNWAIYAEEEKGLVREEARDG